MLFFAACKKDTPTTTSTLTILKGEVFANLDYTNDTIGNLTPFFKEHAKAGTVITVLVNPNDLQSNPDTSKKYDDYRYTATVDANGAYSVSIPAKNNGTKVKIVQDDFDFQATIAPSTTMRMIYKGPAVPVETTVYRGTIQVMDLFY